MQLVKRAREPSDLKNDVPHEFSVKQRPLVRLPELLESSALGPSKEQVAVWALFDGSDEFNDVWMLGFTQVDVRLDLTFPFLVQLLELLLIPGLSVDLPDDLDGNVGPASIKLFYLSARHDVTR